MRSDKDFEAKLRKLEAVIILGQNENKKLIMPDPKYDSRALWQDGIYRIYLCR